MTRLKPLSDRLVVKKLDTGVGSEYTYVDIPDTLKSSALGKGLVVRVGKGYRVEQGFAELEVKAGDHIYFDDSTPRQKVKEGDESFIFLREAEVIAIIEEVSSE